MIRNSTGSTQRSISNKSLTQTLLISLGGSMLCHIVTIAGITYLAQNAEAPMEIITIDRVELDPELVAAPSIKPIVSVTTPAAPPPIRPIAPIAKPMLVPEPKVVRSIIATVPSPKHVVIPTPKPIVTPPPIVKINKIPLSVKQPIAPLTNFISPQSDRVTKSSTPTQDFRPKTNRSQPPSFTPNQFKETNNQPDFGSTSLPPTRSIPKINNNRGSNSSNDRSTPNQPDRGNKLARSNSISPIGTDQTNPNSNNQHKSPHDLGKTPDDLAGSNLPIGNVNSGSGGSGHNPQTAPNSSGSGDGNHQTVLGAGKRLGESGGNSNGTSNSPRGNVGGTGNGDKFSNLNGNDKLGTGTPGNITTGDNRKLSIQCLSNCDIRYPDNLEDADTGKDKILVKVTIDANGSTTNAEIVRSSGNQKLDLFTLDKVKKMQFTAVDKLQIFRIKISTLVGKQ